jgi:hypothetical protein
VRGIGIDLITWQNNGRGRALIIGKVESVSEYSGWCTDMRVGLTLSHRHYAGDQRSDHCPPAA